MPNYLLILFLSLMLALPARAQSNLNLKFFGLSLHPRGDVNAPLMPLNPDNKGYLVLNLGASLGYEYFLKPGKFSLKVIQAAYSDCAAKLGGFSHVGVRWVIFNKGKHSLNGGLGPTLVYRRNWHSIPGYQDSGYFNGRPTDTWQYKFIPYAGEFEYNVVLSDKYSLSTGFVPGYPDLISLSVGLRYWLGKNKPEIKKQPDLPAVRL